MKISPKRVAIAATITNVLTILPFVGLTAFLAWISHDMFYKFLISNNEKFLSIVSFFILVSSLISLGISFFSNFFIISLYNRYVQSADKEGQKGLDFRKMFAASAMVSFVIYFILFILLGIKDIWKPNIVGSPFKLLPFFFDVFILFMIAKLFYDYLFLKNFFKFLNKEKIDTVKSKTGIFVRAFAFSRLWAKAIPTYSLMAIAVIAMMFFPIKITPGPQLMLFYYFLLFLGVLPGLDYLYSLMRGWIFIEVYSKLDYYYTNRKNK